MTSSLQPNPGLSTDINRYLANLDAVLPRRSRKGDRAAQLLHGALREFANVHASVWDTLNSFLEECEAFHRRQFWVDPDYVNHDDGRCWLPLFLVGHAWATALESIARIRLPDSLGRARRIVLRPIGQGAPQSIRVVLRRRLSGVTEAAFRRFVSQVKPVAPRIESIYDADSAVLEIHQGHALEFVFEDPHSPNIPINGGMPAWLDTLLEMNAVEQVDLLYPLMHRDVPTLAEFVSVICVMPDCPVEWRTKEQFPTQAAFQAIADSLGQGADEPFHLLVSAVENEWLPLANAFVARSAAVPFGANLGDSDTQSALVRHVSRLMTLPPGLEMRNDSDYDSLRHAYCRPSEQNHVLTPSPVVAAIPENAAESIVLRLNDVTYVALWARYFKSRASQAIESLAAVSTSAPQASTKPVKGVSTEYLVRVNTSICDFTACILATVETALDVLISTEAQADEARTTRKRYQQLHALPVLVDGDAGDQGEAEAVRHIAHLTLTASSRTDRSRGLAALMYAMTENDVISDSEMYGRIDDRFVIATLLEDDAFARNAPASAAKWSREIRDKIDGMAARPVQDNVLAKFASLARDLESLCSDKEQPSVASANKAGKVGGRAGRGQQSDPP